MGNYRKQSGSGYVAWTPRLGLQQSCKGANYQCFIAVVFNLDVVAKSPERILVAQSGNALFKQNLKSERQKAKAYGLKYIKIEGFYSQKDKVLGQMTDWEKMLALSALTRDQHPEYARTLQINRKV